MVIVGIDCGKDRVDAVMLNGEMFAACWTTDLSKLKHRERDSCLKRMRFDLMAWMRDSPVEAIYVEEAIAITSRRVAIWMAHTVGMVLTLPYPVYTVAVDSWKQELCKAGASKERVKEVVSGRYPETVEIFGDRQDLFDATGVAVFGQADQNKRDLFGPGSTPTTHPAGS
jgi:hypothetical protein